MSTIEIKKISITDLDTDVIVNPTNNTLRAGGGVCGTIFRAAGLTKLQAACAQIGHCDTGSAVITSGFNLKAKYIIHAVGPVWSGGQNDEHKLLYGAYQRSLELATENCCISIGFPLISSGKFGYPADMAWKIALKACTDFLNNRFLNHEKQTDIIFAVLSDSIFNIGTDILREAASRYKIADKNDWNTSDMPMTHDTFILNRSFTDSQMKALRKGNIPQEMEDKWFWYMEYNTLFAYRSWTGYCIYRIDFSQDNNHKVTVNRDPKQYTCTNIDEERELLNRLLNIWSDGIYNNYYYEWKWTVSKKQK